MGQTQHLDPLRAGPAGPEDARPCEVPAWASGTWPPPRLRVYASRRWLRAGVALGLAGLAGFALMRQWPAALAAALLALWCGGRWFARLPLLEFSEFGACLFLNGPYRRPFFAPWTRVQSVRCDQGAGGDSLALEVTGAGPLRWPARSLDGDLPAMLQAIWTLRAATEPGRRLDCGSGESSPSRP